MTRTSLEHGAGARGQVDLDRRIVVGYDGTDEAVAALEWAVDEAIASDGDVRVVTCVDPFRPLAERRCPRLAPVFAAATRMVESTRPAADGRPTEFDATIVHDVAWTRLVTESAGSPMLVIGTSGHLLLGAWRLGATAHEVLRRASVPVVLVPHDRPTQRYGRVVVGVDGTTSNAALAWAAHRAAARSAELVVVHAADLDDRDGQVARAAEAILEQAQRSAQQITPHGVTARLVESPVTNSLLAQGFHADLLVVGTGDVHGRPSSAGSVARAVAACATTPTVVVREAIGADGDAP